MSHRPRTKLLLKLGVFLLLGAILNVAVAWGCSLFRAATPSETSAGFLAQAQGGWEAYTEYAWGATTLTGYPRAGKPMLPAFNETKLFPPRLRWQDELQRIASASPDFKLSGFQILDARGWPMLALQTRWDKDRWKWGIEYSRDVTKIPGGVRYDSLKALPLCPIWPGFAINTIFFAVVLWLPFAWLWLSGKIRRFMRIRAHRCPACGYKIADGVGPRCSECGHPLN